VVELEMRYLWQEDIRPDNRRLAAFLGEDAQTPLDAAVVETLGGVRATAEKVTAGAARASSSGNNAAVEATGATDGRGRHLQPVRTGV
jgi:hypothetical protein